MNERLYSEILSHIESIAPFYTPEWRFNPEKPDVGSAIAIVFAKQLCGTIERFYRMKDNQKITFFNKLGALPLPATPAKGVVSFGLSDSRVKGSLIEKGFKLYSQNKDENGNTYVFETEREIFATPTDIIHTIYVDKEKDVVIVCDEKPKEFSIGKTGKGTHKLTLSHELINNANNDVKLFIIIDGPQKSLWTENLCNADLTSLRLKKENESIDLTAEEIGGEILLTSFPDEASDGQIEIEINDITAFENLSPPVFFLRAECKRAKAERVYVNGEAEIQNRFYPFMRQYATGNEMTLMCDNILRHKNAKITLSFTIGFEKEETEETIPITLPQKLIVSKKNIPEPIKSDITIEDVVWEYWNGRGFAPLSLIKSDARMFSGLSTGGDEVKERKIKLEFIRPSDMEMFLTGADEGYCIRARIKEASNFYKRPARIYVPFVEDITFEFETPKSEIARISTENNGEKSLGFIHGMPVFYRPIEREPTLYLGFESPPAGGCISLLFICPKTDKRRSFNLYYLDEAERRALHCDDETHGLTQTGIVAFTINNEFMATEKYGNTAYYLALCFEGNTDGIEIESIYINSVPVIQCDNTDGDRFYTDGRTRTFTLGNKNIISEKIFLAETFNGEEKETLLDKSQYVIDRAEGIITLCFKPPADAVIRADYRYGGGSGANAESGMDFTLGFSVGYVNTAINPVPVLGGTERETDDETMLRFGRELRHRNRSVTEGDYEDLLAGQGVEAVKCLRRKDGSVKIAMLVHDYNLPYVFDDTKKRAQEKLKAICPIGFGLPEILSPDFITINVSVGIVCNDKGVLKKAYKLIEDICNPIIWVKNVGFGRLPDSEMIKDALLSLPGVESCYRLLIRRERNTAEINTVSDFALPVSGEHILKYRYSNNGRVVC